MEVVFSLFFLSISLVFLLWLHHIKSTKQQKLPPSPLKLPIIGNLHQLGTLPHHNLRALSNKHGPLMLLHLGSIQTLVVSSAEIAQEILKTQDIIFASRPVFNLADKLIYGSTDLVFSPYGEYWRQLRKICVVELLNAKRVLSFHQVRGEEVANMVETIRKSSTATVDLTEIILTFLGNLVSRVAMGKRYGDDGNNQFSKLAKELNELFGSFIVGDYFPWLAWVDMITGLDARIKRNARGFDAFLDLVIEDHLSRRVPTDGQDGKMDGDFVDFLLQVQMNSSLDIPFTRDNLKAIILDMFAAGVDTTSATIEWAMAELI